MTRTLGEGLVTFLNLSVTEPGCECLSWYGSGSPVNGDSSSDKDDDVIWNYIS